MKPQLIALYSDRPQCGKTTIAKWLARWHFPCLCTGFAEPIKDMIESLLSKLGYGPDQTRDMLYGGAKDRPIPELGGRTTRYLLRTAGTEWGRELVDPDIWVAAAMPNIKGYLAQGFRIVIDDMRFPNEYAALYELRQTGVSVEFWRVARKQAPPDQSDHASEGALDYFSFDREIANDYTTVEELHTHLESIWT